MKKILLLDGYNLIYRARYSFNRGEFGTVFSFFRSLRPLVDRFKPDQAYFVLEGHPVDRIELYKDYKKNRPQDDDTNFIKQRNIIIDFMKSYLPIQVLRHPQYECDDVIAFLAQSNENNEYTIVSTDTDFMQLLVDENVCIFNPVKKTFMDRPGFDYVKWKALRGDASDNINGIRGVGDKTALKLVNNPENFEKFLREDSHRKATFDRNVKLIQFEKNINPGLFEMSGWKSDWINLRKHFQTMEFNSITNDKSWKKYHESFETLEVKVG